RRLRKAVESEQIQVEMEYEDDYLEELQIREREIAQAKNVIGEQKNALEEKDNVIEEQKKIIEELKRQLTGIRK
ncbi:MAG: hypothetical protein LBJ47_04220, partial [Tannerella sp.]|nr:hypothetical protein [Tannerella sp.]